MKKIKRAPAVCGGAPVCRKGNRGVHKRVLDRVLSTMGASQRALSQRGPPLESATEYKSSHTLCYFPVVSLVDYSISTCALAATKSRAHCG